MKKTLNSGKIWTVLSALLFFMTCGVFVAYAATSGGADFSKWRTDKMGPVLYETGWNELMDELNKLVPDGAVMAFDLEECPDGWSEYIPANEGRFLMGSKTNIGKKSTGTNYLTLTVSQLPSHSHYIRYGESENKIGDNANYRPVVVDWSTGRYPTTETTNSYSSSSKTGQWINSVTTSRVGSGDPIDITNANVKVLYCIKGDYTYVGDHTVNFKTNSPLMGSVDKSATVAPEGTSITYNPVGKSVKVGSIVEAKATPKLGYEFESWGGDCGNVLTKNCEIIAKFKKVENCSFEMTIRGVDCSLYQGNTNTVSKQCSEAMCSANAELTCGGGVSCTWSKIKSFYQGSYYTEEGTCECS